MSADLKSNPQSGLKSDLKAGLKYQRVLLKVSGEALMGDREYGLDPKLRAELRAAAKVKVGERFDETDFEADKLALAALMSLPPTSCNAIRVP
jgi:hypothetical protein